MGDAQGRSLLLTGDIEAEQEQRLLRDHAVALASSVLAVPHHGSKTSSTAECLDAVAQAGYRNRFGHPVPPVLGRYAGRGIAMQQQSDTCGGWVRRPGQGEPAGRCEREERRRYWHHRLPAHGAEVATR